MDVAGPALRRRAIPAWFAPAATGAVALAGCVTVGLADPATPGSYGFCPFLALTGRWCPGCGSLRAVNRLVHGDIAAAVGFNVLLVLALPILVWWWVAWTLPTVGGPRVRPGLPGVRGTWIVLAALIGFWVLRNLPYAPFSALAP